MAIPPSLGLDGNRDRLGGHHPAVPNNLMRGLPYTLSPSSLTSIPNVAP